MNGQTDVQMNGWMDGWMDRWTDGQIDGWMDGRTDGWMDKASYRVTCPRLKTRRGFLKVKLNLTNLRSEAQFICRL